MCVCVYVVLRDALGSLTAEHVDRLLLRRCCACAVVSIQIMKKFILYCVFRVFICSST